jgi:hypothetical protein
MTAFQGCPVVHLELATGSFGSVSDFGFVEAM